MSEPAAFALLWLVGTALLALPFMPLWREWTHPSDATALAVSPDAANDADHFARALRHEVGADPGRDPDALPAAWVHEPDPLVVARRLRLDARIECQGPVYVRGSFEAPAGVQLRAAMAEGDMRLGPGSEVEQWVHADGRLRVGAGSVVLRRATAGRAIRLEPGCTFERLSAPTLHFGAAASPIGRALPKDSPAASFDSLPRAQRRTASLHRIEGDCAIAADSHFAGSLVVTGILSIGAGSTLRGDVKARNGLVVGERCAILGAITSERRIEVRAGAFVQGPVVSETDVAIGPGVVIGLPEKPTTVTAENIVVQPGAVAHGAVWARDVGLVWSGP